MPGTKPPPFPIDEAAKILRRATRQWKEPIVTAMARRKRDPFKVLVSTILSLRTKDDCTRDASKRLFARARTPRGMLRLDVGLVAELIYPVGFYKTKAKTIREVCRVLLDEFGGEVPDTIDELLSLKGVGRKTANLVLSQGYGKHAICVDTHVHRIANRWGYVDTKTPDETEMALREILPRRHWIEINDWLVAYGQNLCTPVSPWCGQCELSRWCRRVGVERSR